MPPLMVKFYHAYEFLVKFFWDFYNVYRIIKMVIIVELLDAIDKRRSIRKYSNQEISESLIIKAIKDGIKAPSAHNRQPWRFKIIYGQKKDEIGEILYNKTKDINGHTGPHTSNIIKEAPVIIMVFIDNQNSEYRDMDILSIGACIENIILSLVDKGLGTLWIGNTNYVHEEIKKLLNIPYETVSCIAVGYQTQFPHSRPRKDIEEVLL